MNIKFIIIIIYELLRMIKPSSRWSGTRTMMDKRRTHKTADRKCQEKKKTTPKT
jgi:hypothetical protein